MGIITKIESQKRSKDRVNIYVDGEYFTAVFTEIIYNFNIKKGMEINEEELKPILKKEMYLGCKNKALNILSKADQSEKILKDKLLIDYEEDTIDLVIEFLKNNKFLDDEILAQKITNTNINLNKFGKNKIKQNLYNKGIDRDLISDVMDNIDNDVEYENALYLGKKRISRIKDTDKNKVKQKLYQHLSYKGFSYDIVNRVIRDLLNSSDEYDYL